MSHAKKDSTASAVDMSALDDALGDEVSAAPAGDAKAKPEAEGYSLGGSTADAEDDLYAKESDKKPTTSSSPAAPKLPIQGKGAASGIKSNIAVIKPFNPDADSSNASAAPTAQEANKNAGAADESKVGKKGDDSPATLSPNSLRSSSPTPSSLPQYNSVNSKNNTATDPNLDTLASMFPDLPRGTIGDVLRAHGGNMEQAADALLSMDHSGAGAGVGDRAAEDVATQNDEALARALMQQEEEAMTAERAQILRRQQQQQQEQGFASAGRGGMNNWLGGGNNAGGRAPEPERTYDVSNLNYQPRARRTPGQQQAQTPPAHSQQQQGYYAYQQQPQQQRQQYDAAQQQAGSQGRSILPTESDVKQWSETFDRYAEVGLAKAASTFSSLKARVNQGLSEARERKDNQQQGSSAPANRFQRPTAAGSTGGMQPSQTQSPDLGRRDTYDRDPAPVGDDELAKILARGAQVQGNDDQSRPTIVDRNSGGAFASSKSRPFLDRYGSGSGAGSKARGAPSRGASQSSSTPAASGQGLSGWDAVGRTGSVAPASKSDDAGSKISIHDNSASAPKTAVAAAAGAGVGAGAGVASAASTAHDHDDDSDDLEYQPNPFEDSDNE